MNFKWNRNKEVGNFMIVLVHYCKSVKLGITEHSEFKYALTCSSKPSVAKLKG